jgi:lipid-A-disaccharide synthase
MPTIMLVAGEASGDLHGAHLARALGILAPSWSLTGMGGVRMAEAGVRLLSDLTGLAVVGGSEAVSRLPTLYRTYRKLTRTMAESRPRALVLIDFPEFNLLLARVAKRLGVPVVYFIPPQVWAWRRGRVRRIARLVTKVLAVFPFEVPLYRSAGVSVEFVGHPLLDSLPPELDRIEARRRLNLPDHSTLVGLLPGSRREEVGRLLGPMTEAAEKIQVAHPGVRFALALAPTVKREVVSAAVTACPAKIDVLTRQTHEVMAAADLLLIASGTATLEAACLGTPMVVCYRVSRLSGLIGRLLIRIPWISLANIVANCSVVPELIQADATGERLADEALRLLGEPSRLAAQREAFGRVRRELGEPGAGERAARCVLAVAGSDEAGR